VTLIEEDIQVWNGMYLSKDYNKNCMDMGNSDIALVGTMRLRGMLLDTVMDHSIQEHFVQ